VGGDPIPGLHELLREAFEKDPGVFYWVLLSLKARERLRE